MISNPMLAAETAKRAANSCRLGLEREGRPLSLEVISKLPNEGDLNHQDTKGTKNNKK
jgi:hypothetical protein